jgi:hypothetical protein
LGLRERLYLESALRDPICSAELSHFSEVIFVGGDRWNVCYCDRLSVNA